MGNRKFARESCFKLPANLQTVTAYFFFVLFCLLRYKNDFSYHSGFRFSSSIQLSAAVAVAKGKGNIFNNEAFFLCKVQCYDDDDAEHSRI
ncbi:hypothetical protein DERF_009601 [Dermatophagoides farinae]|uniref:Uncharacterized protein n=1 Tax=Dermatophagoides farinae TaxID=6954 RepID=A0A922HUA6_DERFA|nr:hypothetical protein DERF_009601 [Dermatophagoides farinae]